MTETYTLSLEDKTNLGDIATTLVSEYPDINKIVLHGTNTISTLREDSDCHIHVSRDYEGSSISLSTRLHMLLRNKGYKGQETLVIPVVRVQNVSDTVELNNPNKGIQGVVLYGNE